VGLDREYLSELNRGTGGSRAFEWADWMLDKGLFDAQLSEQELFKRVITELESCATEPAPCPPGVNQQEIGLLQFALSIHSHAPKVEAQYQFYESTVMKDFGNSSAGAGVWAAWNGKVYSSVESLRIALEEPKLSEISTGNSNVLLSFDHIKPLQSGGKDKLVFLYVDPFDPAFKDFHAFLSKEASNGSLRYILRFKTPAVEKDLAVPLVLSGYGVELSIKNTEYKVLDDRKLQAETSAIESTDESSSEKAQDILDEPIPSIVKLTRKQNEILQQATVQYAVNRNNSLSAFVKAISDFPKHAHTIANNVTADSETLVEMKANTVSYGRRSGTGLWLNGKRLDAERLEVFRYVCILIWQFIQAHCWSK
jgi:UDP-glucose:glycoprotein glucosyltransferase